MTDGQNTEQLRHLEKEPARKVRVLAAEDELTLRLLFKKLFGSLVGKGQPFDSYEIFPDGLQALAAYEAADEPYTAAILDHHMPGMVGAELAKVLKERDPNIVTVMFSSKTKEDLGELAEYIDLSLTKPFDLTEAERMAHEISARVRGLPQQ